MRTAVLALALIAAAEAFAPAAVAGAPKVTQTLNFAFCLQTAVDRSC